MIDSNVIIYAHDPSEPDKQDKALILLDELGANNELNLSVQTLHEFYVRITKPNKSPALSHTEAHDIINDFFVTATVYPLTADVTRRALYAVEKYQLPMWDALIWAVAKEYGDTVVYTEDLPSQPEIEGVRYINPFA